MCANKMRCILVMGALGIAAMTLVGCPSPVQHWELVQTTTKPAIRVTEVTKPGARSKLADVKRLPVHLMARTGRGALPPNPFGPFFSASDLGQIELSIKWVPGFASNATLYHNQFFNGHPGGNIYARYYHQGNLPFPDPTPIPYPIPYPLPGAHPNPNSTTNLIFSLHRINPSSKYGGTVELLFMLKEDFEVELRKDDNLWDIRAMGARLYVRPSKYYLNQPASARNAHQIVDVEFKPMQVTAYKGTTQGTTAQLADLAPVAFDETSSKLAEFLQQLADFVEAQTGLNGALSSLVHGWIHYKNDKMFDPTSPDIVDAIEIQDDILLLITHVGEPWVEIYAMAEDVEMDTEIGEEEITVEMSASVSYTQGGQEDCASYTSGEMGDKESTRWVLLYLFPLAKCDDIAKIEVDLHFTEDDGDWGIAEECLDDKEIVPDCELINLLNYNLPKMISETESDKLALEEIVDEYLVGSYIFRSKTILRLR